MLEKLVRKKLKKSLEKIQCWYKKSYRSVQKNPARRETEKSSKVQKLRNEFQKKIETTWKKS